MIDVAERIEHLFGVMEGEAVIFPGLPFAVSVVDDRGRILVMLPQGCDRERRAGALAEAILRHAVARGDPQAVIAFLRRALLDERPERQPCTAASVAAWIPTATER